MNKLKTRIVSYIDATDYKLLNRLPIIISINGRNFNKTTSLIKKPYDETLAECLLSTALKLCSEIDGALFSYQHNDEIVIVIRNDQNIDTSSYYDNRIQKICSATSSIATSHFIKCSNKANLNLIGDAIFTSNVIAVPNITEAVNAMIYKQQHNFYISIQNACFYELLKSNTKDNIKEMLNGLSVDEKIDLLNQECGIDFNSYPTAFRRGAALYKSPKITDGSVKNKWSVNLELPIFTKDIAFLGNLFNTGSDIYRGD